MSEDSDTDNSPAAVPMPHIKAPGPLVLSSDHEHFLKNGLSGNRCGTIMSLYPDWLHIPNSITLFLVTVGQEALEIYNSFEYDDGEDQTQLEVIIRKFDKFFMGEINETNERYIFNQRNQKAGETFETYYASLT